MTYSKDPVRNYESAQKAHDNQEHPEYSAGVLFNASLEEKAETLSADVVTVVRDYFDEVGLNADDMTVSVYDNLIDAMETAAKNLITLKMEKE